MTYKEIADKYVDLFILIIETAGDVTNNQSYKNIEKIIDKSKEEINQAIENEVEFGIFIVLLITAVLIDIHNIEKLYEKNEDEMYELINDMWTRYLKKPTRKFLAQNGMKLIDELNYCSIILKKKK